MFMFVFAIAMVSSAPQPFITENSDSGLDIAYRPVDTLKVGEEYRVHVHVFNKSNAISMTNTTTTCFYHLYNRTGWDIDLADLEFEAYNGVDFAYTINGGNFSEEGAYTIIIQCTETATGGTGYATGYFEVTKGGKSETTGNLLIMFILLFFLVSGMAIYSFMWVLNRFAKLDVGLNQVVLSYSSFGIYLMYYYFANLYWGNTFVMDLLESFLWVCGFMNLFIVMVLFVLTLVKNFGDTQ